MFDIVIPCYNEARRLDHQQVKVLLDADDVALTFVDDGSTDNTYDVLRGIADEFPDRVTLLSPGENRGKAEAVRLGLTHAAGSGAEHVGYLDADFATPAHEFLRLAQVLREEQATQAVLGARVALLGRSIARSRVRHYLGRVFATVSSVSLDLRVYDTQCGAKIFRVSPQLKEALGDPFHSRWAFDVELLARLASELRESESGFGLRTFVEVPLNEWHDVKGSKVGLRDAAVAFAELLRLWKRRRSGQLVRRR